jgi:hypothetical protein
MSVTFKVDGKSPKKDGSQSMWGKNSEALNIVNLREAAYKASQETNQPLFTEHTRIELTMHINQNEIETIGDLDNFITGVCDALQPADPRANLHKTIQESPISPLEPILYHTDAKVMKIHAKKIPTKDTNHYTITVTQLNLNK